MTICVGKQNGDDIVSILDNIAGWTFLSDGYLSGRHSASVGCRVLMNDWDNRPGTGSG